MFWAFTNSSVHLEGAKSFYGLILAGAQVGAIFGSTLATNAEWLSLPTCYALGGVMPACMSVLIFFYSRGHGRHVPPETPRKVSRRRRGSASTHPHHEGCNGSAQALMLAHPFAGAGAEVASDRRGGGAAHRVPAPLRHGAGRHFLPLRDRAHHPRLRDEGRRQAGRPRSPLRSAAMANLPACLPLYR